MCFVFVFWINKCWFRCSQCTQCSVYSKVYVNVSALCFVFRETYQASTLLWAASFWTWHWWIWWLDLTPSPRRLLLCGSRLTCTCSSLRSVQIVFLSSLRTSAVILTEKCEHYLWNIESFLSKQTKCLFQKN